MKQSRLLATLLAGALLLAFNAGATTLIEMNLATLTDRSDKIFRGTVMSVTEITVRGGGGDLPAIQYTIRVDESMKGNHVDRQGQQYAVIRMLGSLKQYHAGKPPIPGFPLLREGGEYLLMVAPEGPIGLTTTMGLGQGAFNIFSDPNTREDMALNGFNNASLFKGMSAGMPDDGPVSYNSLVGLIKSELGR
ncbi:MAG: hypothetical protein HKP21_12380 [Xanthomonadales bacterium]|nr:hypothetical protein [Gammaproteobacteria bacterium]MBT8074490.1 hypothetical protein [Gammaproteobacteria bacterium]NNK05344.1 hypothetical protein [Xanthomonadales bacterium]